MESARLLVIDGEDVICRDLNRELRTRGYSCTVAGDGEEAVERLATDQYELVFCALDLPGASGLDVTRLILSEYPETAVVIMAASDDPEIAHTAIEYGAYGYVIKPFTANQVLIAADNALIRRSLELENRRIRSTLEETVRRRTRELRDAVRSLEQSTGELRRARGQTIELLGRALEYRDEETADHIERMSRYCSLLASRFGLDPESMRMASAMHDVGKIAIPDRILRKPGQLDAEERRQMERHAELGHQMLCRSGSQLLDLAATIALTHHERWDGGGYPRGLAERGIPLEGRIAAVADVFDALTSDRVYRKAMPITEALTIMHAERGRHFDPDVLDAFLESLADAEAIRHRYAFHPEPHALSVGARAAGGMEI